MAIIRKPSPHFKPGRNGYKPEAIVIHIMEGTLTGTDSWFANPASRVSAHYGVGKLGAVHQYVNEEDTAYHAGRVHAPSWKGIKPSGKNAYINPNFYTVGIEHEGNENSEWTEAMYSASASLVAAIAKKWSIPLDRDHVIGHHEIYSIKTCPGHRVDLGKLIALASGSFNDAESPAIVDMPGSGITRTALKLRKTPNRSQAHIDVVPINTVLQYDGYTDEGEAVDGNHTWMYQDKPDNTRIWFWSGGLKGM